MDLNNSTTPKSEQDLAQTPKWFVRAVELHFGIQFDLDVCASAATAKTKAFYSEVENGLIQGWSDSNWCNPPYSKIMPWVEKATKEAASGSFSALLIPDKPEVGYVRACNDAADTIIHMPFRLNFLRPDGAEFLDKNGKKQGPKFPVMLAIFTTIGLKLATRNEYVDFREYRGLDVDIEND